MKKLIVTMTVAALLSQGCAPVLIAGAFAKSSATKKQRREFVTNLQKTNADREAHKLPPLDFCTEATHFDPKWEASLKECQK